MSDIKEMIIAKMKLVVILNEIAWLMPDNEFYETFHDTITFLGDYW